MKLNYEVLRCVMINFQDAPFSPDVDTIIKKTTADGTFSEIDVRYAIKQAIDSNLLEGKNYDAMGSFPIPIVTDISPAGHKFIDSISDNTAWSKVKEELIENGVPITIPSITRVIAKLFF